MKKKMKLGDKSPYFDKNKEPLCLGDDIKLKGEKGFQIRIRYGLWVIYPIGALCYFPIEENDYTDKNNVIKNVEKTNSITSCVGLACQELVK